LKLGLQKISAYSGICKIST